MYVLLLFRTNTVIANSLSQSRYICTIYWSWWYLLCLFCAFVALCACESAQQHASVINTRSIIKTMHPMQNMHVHRAATLWARHHRAAMTNKLHLLPSLSIYFRSVVVKTTAQRPACWYTQIVDRAKNMKIRQTTSHHTAAELALATKHRGASRA